MPAWTQSSLEDNHLTDCHSVHAKLADIASARGALDASEAELLLAADELQIWRVYGQPTLAAFLEQTLGYTPHACSERLRVARELRELPQLHAALAAGRLHFSAVRELTRVATRDTEDAWIAEAIGKNVRQVEQAVAGHTKGDLPDDPADPDTAPRHVGFELARMRRQVYARDHHRCSVPGCRSARNLDVHHLHFQSHGGRHEIQNLTTLCSAHHALLHEETLRVRGKAPDLVYERRTEDGDAWQRIT